MHELDALLLAAVRTAPRRHRMPPLPASGDAAWACGTEAALAFALEALRIAQEGGARPSPETDRLFARALDALIRASLDAQRGDASFQALVLQAHDVDVAWHARLAGGEAADRRAVRAATDAFAHPGKLRGRPPGVLRDRLAALHRLAAAGRWTELRQAAERMLAVDANEDAELGRALPPLLAHPGLERLERGAALQGVESVRRYRALLERRGPPAAGAGAAGQGRTAARAGAFAEAAAVQSFGRIAGWLNAAAGAARYRAVHGLCNPRELTAPPRGKAEWDAAIVRTAPDAGAADCGAPEAREADRGVTELVLLAEVKSAPPAAAEDLPRLVRGLQALARADAGAAYAFGGAAGEEPVRIAGASLRRLRPRGLVPPAGVIYACASDPDAPPRWLGAAAKGMLLADRASLAHADRLLRGGTPSADELLPLWNALQEAPRWRAVVQQYEAARLAGELMLHPLDLEHAVQSALAGGRAGRGAPSAHPR